MLLAVACAPLVVAFVVACFRDPLRYALPPYTVLIPFSSLLTIAPGPMGSVSTLLGLLLGAALALEVSGAESSPRAAVARAAGAIENGRAAALLGQLAAYGGGMQ